MKYADLYKNTQKIVLLQIYTIYNKNLKKYTEKFIKINQNNIIVLIL